MKSLSFYIAILILFLLVPASILHAAEGDSLWSQTYGGDDEDWAWSLIQDADGGYSMAGWSESSVGYYEDAYVVKTDAAGDTLWTRFLGGTGADRAWEHSQTADGGYLVAGFISAPMTSVCDMWLARLDAQGDTLWTRAWGGSGSEEARAMAPTSGGGCVMAGYTESFGVGLADFYVVRTDANGDSLWGRTFGGEATEWASAVIQTSDDDILAAGVTVSFGAGSEDIWVVKISGDGDSLWSHTYGGDETDYVWSIIEVSDGGYLLAGSTGSFGAGLEDMWLVRIDEDGNELWNQTFGGMSDDEGWSVVETSDGGFLIAGKTESFGAGADDLWLVKTSADGDSLWSRTFGDTGQDGGYAVIQNSDGNYLAAGATWSFTGVRNEMWLVCVEGVGTGIEQQPIATPHCFALDVHPNPFNPSTVASFELRVPSHVSLRVYDTAGRLAATLVDGWREAGAHKATFDGSDLPSGIYLARLTAGDIQETQKLILLK